MPKMGKIIAKKEIQDILKAKKRNRKKSKHHQKELDQLADRIKIWVSSKLYWVNPAFEAIIRSALFEHSNVDWIALLELIHEQYPEIDKDYFFEDNFASDSPE